MARVLQGLDILRKTAILVILVVAGIWLFKKWGQLPPVSDWFAPKPVIIDETPLIIAEIKSIAELHTARLYCEVIADSVILSKPDAILNALQNTVIGGPLLASGYSASKRIVLVARGRIVAGIDLKGGGREKVRISGDSVFLSIPPARVIEAIANPSDFEVFLEEGDWGTAEIAAVKQKAVRNMIEEANRRGLVNMANERAVSLMKSFLLSCGFSYAEVQINNGP